MKPVEGSMEFEMKNETNFTSLNAIALPEYSVDENVQTDSSGYQGKTPVTIITGFLGSGKSTLLHNILTRHHQQKIAILVNEFAPSMEIEKLSIKRDSNMSSEDWIELENGCICCTVKDNAVIQLENLMERKGRFDHVLIEASGIADPASLINMFWLDDALQGKVYLDGVVCVVDGFANDFSDVPQEMIVQLAYANVVLLNKVDLVKREVLLNHPEPSANATEKKISLILSFIHDINPSCRIHQTSYCNIEELDENIFNLGGPFKTPNLSVEPVHDFHYKTYDKIVFSCQGCGVDIEKLESFVQNLLWERTISNESYPTMDILRIKGVIKDRNNNIFLIHAVKDIYEFKQIFPLEPIHEYKIVFIGRNIPLEIKESLEIVQFH